MTLNKTLEKLGLGLLTFLFRANVYAFSYIIVKIISDYMKYGWH